MKPSLSQTETCPTCGAKVISNKYGPAATTSELTFKCGAVYIYDDLDKPRFVPTAIKVCEVGAT